MTNEEILEKLIEHGYYGKDFLIEDKEKSWYSVIHYQPEFEYVTAYEHDPEYFDFIRPMRAECIKNAFYYVPMIEKDGKEEYYHLYDEILAPVMLFCDMEEAKVFYKNGDIPSLECCKKMNLFDLINSFDYDVEFLAISDFDCIPVYRSFYLDYLDFAKKISKERIEELIIYSRFNRRY